MIADVKKKKEIQRQLLDQHLQQHIVKAEEFRIALKVEENMIAFLQTELETLFQAELEALNGNT